MTSPNLGPESLNDFDGAANAIGLAAMQAMQAEDIIDSQISEVAGPLGGVVSWVTDGLGTIIADIQAYATTGDRRNLKAAAEFVHERIDDIMSGVTTMMMDLLAAFEGKYTGKDPVLRDVQKFMNGIRGFITAVQNLVEDVIRGIIRAVRGVPVVGPSVADMIAELTGLKKTAVNAEQSAINVGTQVNYVQQVIALKSGRGFWETGPDRTGTVTFPYSLLHLHSHTASFNLGASSNGAHSHAISGGTTSRAGDHGHRITGSVTVDEMDVPTVNVTTDFAPIGTIIFDTAATRKVVTWLAYKSGSVTSFNLDIFQMKDDGSTELVYSSPDLSGNLGTQLAWMQHLCSADIPIDVDEIYEVQYRMTGSGMVSLAGINMPNPIPLPGLRPSTMGSGRNPTSLPAPASLTTAERDALYMGPVVWTSLGVDIGQTEIPRFFFDDFNRGDLGARWSRFGTIGIRDNRLRNTGGAFDVSVGAAQYAQPLLTDQCAIEFDFYKDSTGTSYVGGGLCCTSGLAAGAWCVVKNGFLSIQTGSYSSRAIRSPVINGDTGHYKMTYTPSDNTFRVYRDGSTTPLLEWVDATNIVGHGSGHRWVGLSISKTFLGVTADVDNFVAADIDI